MSDEIENEETPVEENPVEETPAAEETPTPEPAVEEAPAEEPAAEEPAAEEPAAEEAPAEEPAAEEAPAADAGDNAPAAEPAGDEADDAEKLPFNEQFRLDRSREAAEAKPSRSNEDRAKEREAERATKAAARRRWRASRKAKTIAAATPGTPTPAAEKVVGNQKIRQGIVVSDKGAKTITVRVDFARRHPKYEKIVRSSAKLRVHDETNDANLGDTVRVIECRPMSRSKRWRLDEVLERAK